MTILRNISGHLDIRPGEGRTALLSVLGAFLILSSLVLGRSLREAAFLGLFEIQKLPHIIAAMAVLSFPVIAVFTRLLRRWRPLMLLRAQICLQMSGLIFLWVLVDQAGIHGPVIIAFFLWTALGFLLIASAFWVLISESFVLRGAKRLIGLIHAGGTAGALATGFALKYLSPRFENPLLMLPALLVFLMFLLWVLYFWPESPVTASQVSTVSMTKAPRGGLGLIRRTPHLRLIALLVMLATMASTLLDYQFKEAACASTSLAENPEAELAGFLGAFYGWTGGVALVIQLALAGRLITTLGVGAVLAILPALLLLGSTGLLLWPALWLITGIKGADLSLRKSLFRPIVEILHLPLTTSVRRRTKTLIDTALDSLAEGLGAVVLFVWVSVFEYPSRLIFLLVIVLVVAFLVLSQRMDKQYLRTVAARLHEREEDAASLIRQANLDENMLSASFTRLEINSILAERDQQRKAEQSADVLDLKVESLISQLGQAGLAEQAKSKLTEMGEDALPQLLLALQDDERDFIERRRIPKILSTQGGSEVDDALIHVLLAERFELRYRAAVALVQRQKSGQAQTTKKRQQRIMKAIREEVIKDKPVWELQEIGGKIDCDDGLVMARVGKRGEQSLEHTFRMFSLIFDAEHVRAAYRGIKLADPKLRNYALEYLERVLPADIRRSLWLFIGDVSERKKRKSSRPLKEIVADLMDRQQSLFPDRPEQEALGEMVDRLDTPEEK